METFRVFDIIPGQAAEGTLTPGRKFLQVIFELVPEEGFLPTERRASRNFWDGFKGKTEDGFDLNIAADQLFISICSACRLDLNTVKWDKNNKAVFASAMGMKVHADLVTHYVKPYTIPGSLSQDATRVQYTTIVLKGENEFNIFRTQGHTVLQDPKEIESIKMLAANIAQRNQEARDARQAARGIPPANERTGTGQVTAERQYQGKRLES